MRLTTRTNIAMRALMYCAINTGPVARKSDIAAACNASENHMAHVINALGHYGFVETMRGRKGGVRLARPPEEIGVGAVFRIFEADAPFTECNAAATNTCPIADCCRLRGALSNALDAFYTSLDTVSLADLVTGNTQLEQILMTEPAA